MNILPAKKLHFGMRLCLEGHSGDGFWGTFSAVVVEADGPKDTLEEAHARAVSTLIKKAELWQRHYSPALLFRITQ